MEIFAAETKSGGKKKEEKLKNGKKRNGNKLTKHHIKSRSRGGGNGNNIIKIPHRVHEAYHILFGNLSPSEAIRFLNVVFRGKELKRPKKKWKSKELYNLQLYIQLKASKEEMIKKFK